MDRNHLNNIERGPTKDHSCEVWSKSNQWFRRRCCLKIVNGRTDGRRRRRTVSDHKSSPWAFGSGELKNTKKQTNNNKNNTKQNKKKYSIPSHPQKVQSSVLHYKDTPIQILKNFTTKNRVFRYSGEAVLTSYHNLCFEQKYENYQNLLSENFHCLVLKFQYFE